MAVNQPSFSEQCQRLHSVGNGLVLRTANAASRMLWPREGVFDGSGTGFSDPEFYNYFDTTPGAQIWSAFNSDNQCAVATEGLANIALRFLLFHASTTLTPATDYVTLRAWGVRPIRLAQDRWALSGQYLWEYTATVGTASTVDSDLQPAAATVSDASYADVLTASAGNPHPSVNSTLGAAGSGRWLRFDMLGYPILILQGVASSADVGWNGEGYPY